MQFNKTFGFEKLDKVTKLERLRNFSLDYHQLIETDGYNFHGTNCPNIVKPLKNLDEHLKEIDEEVILYLDDSPLKINQDVLDYLANDSFNYIKVIVTCIDEKDIKGIENFAQIKLDNKIRLFSKGNKHENY